MILFTHGLGPTFGEAEAILGQYHIVVQMMDHFVVSRTGDPVPIYRLVRTTDGNSLTIQYFPADQRVAHEVLWEWSKHFGISAAEAFKTHLIRRERSVRCAKLMVAA